MMICPVACKALNASFFARIASLTSWSHQGVLFLLSPATLSRFRPQLFSSWWNNCWSEQQPFFLDVLGYIRKLSELRWYTGCKLFPYFFVLQSLPFDPVSHRRPVGFPVWLRFRKPKGTCYQMEISWQFRTSLHSNVLHIRKLIRQNYAKLYERFFIHTRSIPFTLVNLSVLKKRYSWCGVCCYNRAANKYRPFSFSPVGLHVFR